MVVSILFSIIPIEPQYMVIFIRLPCRAPQGLRSHATLTVHAFFFFMNMFEDSAADVGHDTQNASIHSSAQEKSDVNSDQFSTFST